jgi:hypothetical protein
MSRPSACVSLSVQVWEILMLVHDTGRAALSSGVALYDIEVDALSDTAWNWALSEFEDGHYEQVASRMDRKTSHLVLRHNGNITAGARVSIYALPILGRGLALVRFGPFWRRLRQPVSSDIYRATVAALIEEYCNRRGHGLVIRPRPNPDFYGIEGQILGELGFVVRRALPAPERYCADVSQGEAAQLSNFDQKWRYNLRQALKHNFDIRLCDTEAEVATFRQLHENMTVRKSLESAARGMIGALEDLTRLPNPIRMHVILVRHGGEPIAGATIGVLGDTAFYVLGATNDKALKLKADYAMQWWIMRWLNGQNIRWYELGGTGDPGIRQFKKGLIGKLGVIIETAEYDRWTKTSARLATDAIYGIRNARDVAKQLFK